jgi:hypothetical protein
MGLEYGQAQGDAHRGKVAHDCCFATPAVHQILFLFWRKVGDEGKQLLSARNGAAQSLPITAWQPSLDTYTQLQLWQPTAETGAMQDQKLAMPCSIYSNSNWPARSGSSMHVSTFHAPKGAACYLRSSCVCKWMFNLAGLQGVVAVHALGGTWLLAKGGGSIRLHAVVIVFCSSGFVGIPCYAALA